MRKIIFTLIFLSVMSSTYAVDVYLEQVTSLTPGNVAFQVVIAATTSPQNAVSGKVSYNSKFFSLGSISTKDSIITLWLDGPKQLDSHFFEQNRVITFEGVVPGGFTGVLDSTGKEKSGGKVIYVELVPIKEGLTEVSLSDASIYASDGRGTQSSEANQTINILAPKSLPRKADSRADISVTTSTTLSAFVFKDPNLIKDKWFLSFYEDVSVRPVDHFEISESYNSDPSKIYAWKRETSPVMLLDQSRMHYIHVKAIYVDDTKAYVTLPPVEKVTSINNYRGIILLALIATLIASIYAIRTHFFSKPSTR